MTNSALSLLTGCAFAPFVEEMVFRGAITSSLLAWRRNVVVALAAPSLLFAVAHLYFALTPFYFAFGLIAGWFVIRTGSLWPSVVFHATNNILCAATDYINACIPKMDESTETAVSWAFAAASAIGLTACIMVLNRKTKPQNLILISNRFEKTNTFVTYKKQKDDKKEHRYSVLIFKKSRR